MLNTLKMSQRSVADAPWAELDVALERQVDVLEAGARAAGCAARCRTCPTAPALNAAMLNHWSTVSGPSVSPTTFGRPVMFVPTLLLLWLTVNGRPERLV